MEQNYTIPKEHNELSVKFYLKGVLNLSSRAIIDLKKEPMGIQINGKHAIVIDKLKTGDILTIKVPEDNSSYELSDIPVNVVYEDENFLAVEKPFAMTIYPCGVHKDSLLGATATYFKEQGVSYTFRPFYRLDKDTSGIVLIAKNCIFMGATKVEKEYFAVCEGIVPKSGTINAPIVREGERSIRRTIGQGQEAITDYERISTDGEHCLVKFNLRTGRTHQIRVHMAHIGHPLAGDDLYGGSLDTIKRQALHCKNCSVTNSALNFNKIIESDFPEDIEKAFPKLFYKN